jgi:hypothetical protein
MPVVHSVAEAGSQKRALDYQELVMGMKNNFDMLSNNLN